ncbi:MAG: YfhO family protein, partial [Anaerolineae bacterium]
EWRQHKQVASIRVSGSGGLTIQGVALIDQLSNTFHSFVLAQAGRFRLAHSGDVKVYENIDALPRAFVVPEARFAVGDDDAVAMMQDPDFDPSQTVVIAGAAQSIEEGATRNTQYDLRFTHYAPEYITLEVTTDEAGYLVLTDAWYSGWTATVDGAPSEILRADVAFRAVRIGPGAHRIEFRYEPQTVRIGAAISVGVWVIVLSVTFTTHTLPALRRRGQARSRRVSS